MSQGKQSDFGFTQSKKNTGPVECLGQTFESDKARREHYLALLAENLKDPEFRKTPGFPKGTDEAILRLSDPPYYTACPNPFLEEFVRVHGRPYDPDEKYEREPFAADVSEGKYDPVYRRHPYHTKVPHRAIVRYILHYTSPGDFVFDGFCGTGMAGVAASQCGSRDVICSLGYQVRPDGSVLRPEIDSHGKSRWVPFSRLGVRHPILSDLSPIATYIASVYNAESRANAFRADCEKVLDSAKDEFGWMFETEHASGEKGWIESVFWSDVFACNECTNEIVFWETAVDIKNGKVRKSFLCPHCHATLSKRLLVRKWVNTFDPSLGKVRRFGKQIPIRINYTLNSQKYVKVPDASDLARIAEIEALDLKHWHPVDELPNGVNTEQPKRSHGFTNVHHFYARRNLAVLSAFSAEATRQELSALTAVALRITKRYGLTCQSGKWGAGGGPTNGTYYIPALYKELNIIEMIRASIVKQAKGIQSAAMPRPVGIIGTQSLEVLRCPDNSMDYIFIDPPFGANLNYSELNFLWESWLQVWTDSEPEAIENKVQKKGIADYRELMTTCFREAFRILKPGRWATIEFSNTSAAVWNAIQSALLNAGFIVGNVSALDKQKGSFKAQTTPTAVKQDLIISAYKPKAETEKGFVHGGDAERYVWDFVREHLSYLPPFKMEGNDLVRVIERDPRLLFDQVVRYFVRNGGQVPLSSKEFQKGLAERYPERDGMYFLQGQVSEYDRKRTTVGELRQLTLFVSDEASATRWIRQQLQTKPQSFQDLQPQFMQQLQSWDKHEKTIELKEILELNFFCYDGTGPVPSQIKSYLSTNFKDMRNIEADNPRLQAKAKDRWYVPNPNKEGDLEKLRLRTLLKEFEEYRTSTSRKIKQFRTEAVRAGFKHCYDQSDYATIVAVAAKLPEKVIQEDEKLLMYYDVATMRLDD